MCISSRFTLGFAAFSNTLTISSSATVSPNESDFKIKTYGITFETDETSNIYDIASYTSDKKSVAGHMGNPAPLSMSNAVISDDGLHISNMSATFQEGSTVIYFFAIKNEGKYDAYLDLKKYYQLSSGLESMSITCTARDGTSQDLVDQTCQNMIYEIAFYDSEIQGIVPESLEDAYYKLSPGDYLFLDIGIAYSPSNNNVLADGDFDVEIEDVTFEFSTVAPTE